MNTIPYRAADIVDLSCETYDALVARAEAAEAALAIATQKIRAAEEYLRAEPMTVEVERLYFEMCRVFDIEPLEAKSDLITKTLWKLRDELAEERQGRALFARATDRINELESEIAQMRRVVETAKAWASAMGAEENIGDIVTALEDAVIAYHPAVPELAAEAETQDKITSAVLDECHESFEEMKLNWQMACEHLAEAERDAFERGAREMRAAIIEAEEGAMLDGKYIVPPALPEDVPLPDYTP